MYSYSPPNLANGRFSMAGETSDDAVVQKQQQQGNANPTTAGVMAWSLLGAVVFELSWWKTGGGYPCSIPIFLALFCYCYGRELISPSILRVLARNIASNIAFMCREERKCLLLMASYFSIKSGLSVGYPKGEKSNGSPLSLIAFTILFISIFLVPLLLRTITRMVCCCFACVKHSSTASSPHREGPRLNWKKNVKFYWKALNRWRKSILVFSVLVLGSYFMDSSITAILRFLAMGKPCWPLLPPKDTASIPSNILSTYQWHVIFPEYKPMYLVKRFILIGRELGEVCHLLPMLISMYILSQIFLPPKNSLIKSALFASITGVVLGGVTSGSFKILFHRYRPNAYGDPYMWKGPGLTTVDHLQFSKLDLSFPAGHTTVTSAVATCWYAFIQLHFQQLCFSPCMNLLVLCFLYINPFLVLVSRVSECCHWTSDATFGVSNCI